MIKLNANKELDRVVANALVGSALFKSYPSDQKLIGVIEGGFIGHYETTIGLGVSSSKIIKINYESAILDPRLLIGEDVDFEIYLGGEWEYNELFVLEGCIRNNANIRIPKQWLKDNGMWVEEAGE